MEKKSYLINKNRDELSVLNLKVNGQLKNDFIDISELDLETMNIDFDKAKDEIAEFNKKLHLCDNFYDLETGNKNVFHGTIFNMERVLTPESRVFLDNLRHLAELRLYNIKHGKNVTFNNNEANKFKDELLYKIIDSNPAYIRSDESLLIPSFKEILVERSLGRIYQSSPNMIVKNTYYKTSINSPLKSYIELRKLCMEYLYSTVDEYSRKYQLSNSMISELKKCTINGANFFHQLGFSDYFKEEEIIKQK